MKKVIGVIAGVVALVGILGSNWKSIGDCFVFIGKVMTGEETLRGFSGWFAVFVAAILFAFVVAIVIYLVRQILSILKEKK